MGSNSFAIDVENGLSSSPKFLNSKYFYDDNGSRLFQQIIELEEYYVTRAENEIFSRQTDAICEALGDKNSAFDLIELGPGDGIKTAFLIERLLQEQADFSYVPIDISDEAINILTGRFRAKFPALSIRPYTGDYFEVLGNIRLDGKRKIILFLGSSIGNFSPGESRKFFQKIRGVMNSEDRFLIGFDLKKDPRVILRAYDDSQGVTSRFNLNLLSRINKELGGNFVLENFSHYAVYQPIEGAAKSYIISRKKQEVFIEKVGKTFVFEKWEPVFMEISQKYDAQMIEEISLENQFQVEKSFLDENAFFMDTIWKPV